MLDTLFIGSLVFLFLVVFVWAVQRARRIRAEAANREAQALAQMRAGTGPANERQGETVFAGMPSQMLPRAGIEVSEVVDLDELLAGEPHGVAARARARLEEPTNIDAGLDTLPPRPAAPPPAVARAAVAAAASNPPAPPRATAPRPAPVAAPPPRQEPAGAALRELTLAWFEARGYRSSPASPAVRPIELVLRHRGDPARAYAFVVEPRRVTGERVAALANQARSIGLMRLLIVAEGGADEGAAAHRKGVRLIDRGAMDDELSKLDLPVAAKIIAVARKRAAGRAAAAVAH
ncbi:MAG: hypothetical protein AB1761_15425 [Pseudomonadota bacterium]